ncbi:hypothetical protein [Foetidibacter luteolus]|uniref:hypothetical protein n=1 Tax=Foetidibacter luteolus TaxID=2608880 RepID=UPI00129ACA8E|nr:hypothetical protein [Foetidibacter luteolus]
MKEINGKREIQKLIEAVVSKAHFLRTPDLNLDEAVAEMNIILAADSYSLVNTGDGVFGAIGQRSVRKIWQNHAGKTKQFH